MHGEWNTKPARAVVDESSFDLRELGTNEIVDQFDMFNDVLQAALRDGQVLKCSTIYDTEVRQEKSLYDLLFCDSKDLDRTVIQRLMILLDRCADWDIEHSVEVEPLCGINGVEIESWSIGYAASLAPELSVACLGCANSGRSGEIEVSAGLETVSVFFVINTSNWPKFWHFVLVVERPQSTAFFEYASRAYQNLIFHSNLDFGKFNGAYEDVVDWVIRALAAINEKFAIAMEERLGLRDAVQADIASLGVVISPDSPQTHKNAAAMRRRTVNYNGRGVKCEWHAKRLPTIDRIHFSLPDPMLDGKVLIGIFVDHLPT